MVLFVSGIVLFVIVAVLLCDVSFVVVNVPFVSASFVIVFITLSFGIVVFVVVLLVVVFVVVFVAVFVVFLVLLVVGLRATVEDAAVTCLSARVIRLKLSSSWVIPFENKRGNKREEGKEKRTSTLFRGSVACVRECEVRVYVEDASREKEEARTGGEKREQEEGREYYYFQNSSLLFRQHQRRQ